MDDLIDREKAIRLIKTECNPYGKPTIDFESGKKVIGLLKKMPSAQPESKWISVTERLPEEGQRVLVTDEDGEIDIAHIVDYSDIGEGIEWWAHDYKCNPTAWRECPKPYERSEDAEDS